MTNAGTIRPVRIEEELRSSYLDYAMSVIVSRALPDVRDGLKPVQRRILYAMHSMGLAPNSRYKKSAGIVGEVLGKYHPHGDAPVYEALVRMTQEFSLRSPLIDGQGNFGSIDNDPPAAMRYTEARLARVAEEILADLELDTVTWRSNYDDSLQEPMILPARLPNLLANGATGIAVGMATNIPPHNLGETCEAVIHLVDHPDATVDDLMQFIPGPDFPTGAIIQGIEGITNAYTSGSGHIVMRAVADIQEAPRGGRKQIVVTELPYQVNKASLVEKIAHLVRDRRIEGISDIRDESDRDGLRVVIELKRDAQAERVLHNLYKHTSLQSSFHVNMLALVEGQPQLLTLKRTLQLYIAFRREIITRRSQHLLRKAQERAHILEGLRKALATLDEVIAIVRNSQNVEDARNQLILRLTLTEAQAQAILELQLRRLAALEREKLEGEYQQLLKTMGGLEKLLDTPTQLLGLIKDETRQVQEKFSNVRRTNILPEEAIHRSQDELVQPQDVVVTITGRGYIKRIPVETYQIQRRGGKGVRGMTTREDDTIHHLIVANTLDLVCFFTNRGRVYPLKCYDVPADITRTTRGIPVNNLIPLAEGERVTAVIAVSDLKSDGFFLLATRKGLIKSMDLKQFANIRSKGLIGMKLRSGDELVAVSLVKEQQEILMVNRRGYAIRFPATSIRTRSRLAGGVRGMRLSEGDEVVTMGALIPGGHLLVVSQQGYGKLSPLARYPQHDRGGKGTLTFRVNSKTGPLATAQVVSGPGEILLISAKAQVVRISLGEVPILGRSTQGVILWRDREPNDYITSIACFTGIEESDSTQNGPEGGGSATSNRATTATNPHTPKMRAKPKSTDQTES